MTPRFVILAHSGQGAAHYDFMLEHGQALATWQLSQSPLDQARGSVLPARRLADHRSAYLNYQGPVSGNRGRVDRVDAGTYQVVFQDETGWQVLLDGQKLKAMIELRPRGKGEAKDEWLFRRL